MWGFQLKNENNPDFWTLRLLAGSSENLLYLRAWASSDKCVLVSNQMLRVGEEFDVFLVSMWESFELIYELWTIPHFCWREEGEREETALLALGLSKTQSTQSQFSTAQSKFHIMICIALLIVCLTVPNHNQNPTPIILFSFVSKHSLLQF